MKTPDEIKKGLECCTTSHSGCNGCQYNHNGCGDNEEMADALAYIQRLEEREWELFNLLSSAWFTKAAYFKQENGEIYSRISGKYMTFDQAIDEFASELTNFTHLADLIESFSAELGQVKRERDAAIADMKDIADNYVVCMHCKKRDDESGACDKWHDQDGCWQWRGVKEE